jgi:hypothetical protein
MNQVIRELKRQSAGETLAPEQLKGLIRAGYVYRNGDEYVITDKGRDALAQPGVYPQEAVPRSDEASKARGMGCSIDANGGGAGVRLRENKPGK